MGCSKYHPLLQLHPSEGLQKIRFPPPLYSVLHEGRFECPGQSGTDLRRRVLPAVVCRFFEVCINPETAEPFPLVNSQDERDPPAADKYECFVRQSRGQKQGVLLPSIILIFLYICLCGFISPQGIWAPQHRKSVCFPVS